MQGVFATDGKRRRKLSGQNLHELSPGNWKVTLNLPASRNADGKRHRRVAYVRGGIRKAEAKRRELLGKRDQGKLKPRTAGTVGEYIDGWLKGKRVSVEFAPPRGGRGSSRIRSSRTSGPACFATSSPGIFGRCTPSCSRAALVAAHVVPDDDLPVTAPFVPTDHHWDMSLLPML